MNKFNIRDILAGKYSKTSSTFKDSEDIDICGWIRTCRQSKNIIFIALNDGSTIKNLQIVADPKNFDETITKELNTGACIKIIGKIQKSTGSAQKLELMAKKITIIGSSPAEKYPIQPKKHTLDFLRSVSHLRLRTNTYSAVFRIRHALSYAIHSFFNERNFYYMNTPIITSVDAEGAGEMFNVTSFDLDNIPKNEEGKIDYTKDFFDKKVSLSVSGQLAGETGALSLGKIYTFGPTFRAENSNTSRHLAEFWMIEPEMAFYDLDDIIRLAEEFLKNIISYVLQSCEDDLHFLDQRYIQVQKEKPMNERDERSLVEKLHNTISENFQKITYTEAFQILKNSSKNKKKKFKYLVQDWGLDLQSEHERYLTEKHFNKPVIITDFPKKIKAFYMYNNPDDKTVSAMDIILPGIGEIIGGSQREHRYESLLNSIKTNDIDKVKLQWYVDTRKYGTAPHGGFGLGFERIIQYVTGMDNIRDVIPFPRTPGKAEC